MSRELVVCYFLLICVLAQQQHWGLFSLTWPEYQAQPKCSGGVALYLSLAQEFQRQFQFLWWRSGSDFAVWCCHC